MPFCSSCGASVEGRFCAKCGSPAGAAPAGGFSAQAAQETAAAGMPQNLAGALCYALGLITGVLFLVLTPYNQNKFVRFHAFQAIFFHVAFIAFWIVESMLAMTLPWGLSVVASLLGFLLALATLAVWVLLLFKAYNGERFKLPVIGDLAEKQA